MGFKLEQGSDSERMGQLWEVSVVWLEVGWQRQNCMTLRGSEQLLTVSEASSTAMVSILFTSKPVTRMIEVISRTPLGHSDVNAEILESY